MNKDQMFARMFMRRWSGSLAAFVLVAILGSTGLGRDSDTFRGAPPAPPPEANPMQIEVPRGGPVQITLSAYSLTSPIIGYRIHRGVKNGQLGKPKVVEGGLGTIIYKPPPGAGPGEDSFEYEVQSVAGFSAPALVEIKITDKVPQLITPAELDFGDVTPGGSSRRLLILQNIGGGLAEGEVQVPDGWTVDGDSTYRIGAGEKQSMTLVFKPTAMQAYTGDVSYSSNPDRATDLTGREVPEISISQGPVELKAVEGTWVGTIEVENRTEKPRTFKVTPGPQVEADATVTAPPKGAGEIVVRAKAGGELHDFVTVEGEDVKQDVPVFVPAAPGMASSNAPATGTANPPPATVASAGTAPPEAAPPPPMALGDQTTADAGQGVAARHVYALSVDGVGKDEASISSKFSGGGPGPKSYRVEVKVTTLNPIGKIIQRWEPLPNAPVQVNGETITAKLASLTPNTPYTVRLAGVDEQGNVIAASGAGQIWIAKAKGGLRWEWYALAAVVIAMGGWKWRQRRAV